eukprot:12580575-Alexandrium_andersonii.AAC.1
MPPPAGRANFDLIIIYGAQPGADCQLTLVTARRGRSRGGCERAEGRGVVARFRGPPGAPCH